MQKLSLPLPLIYIAFPKVNFLSQVCLTLVSRKKARYGKNEPSPVAKALISVSGNQNNSSVDRLVSPLYNTLVKNNLPHLGRRQSYMGFQELNMEEKIDMGQKYLCLQEAWQILQKYGLQVFLKEVVLWVSSKKHSIVENMGNGYGDQDNFVMSPIQISTGEFLSVSGPSSKGTNWQS